MKTVTKLEKLNELKEEAAIFQQLNHPNIVQFFGLFEVMWFLFSILIKQKNKKTSN